MNPFRAEVEALIMSTDIYPSPGFLRARASSLIAWFFFLTILILLQISCRQFALVYFFSMLTFFESIFVWRALSLQIATRSNKNDVAITTRIPGTTIGAAPFFQLTAILHVMTDAIRVLEPGAFLSLDTHSSLSCVLPTFYQSCILFVPFTRWHQETKHQRHGGKPSASQDLSMQHLRSIRSYRQRGRLDWAVHGRNWTWKISEKGCLLWATKFEFISILTDRMVLIIPFSFSRPRDTWQAASTQTCPDVGEAREAIQSNDECTSGVDFLSRRALSIAPRRRTNCFYNQVRFFFNFNFTPNW
jgi:hypothetical protein